MGTGLPLTFGLQPSLCKNIGWTSLFSLLHMLCEVGGLKGKYMHTRIGQIRETVVHQQTQTQYEQPGITYLSSVLRDIKKNKATN